MGSDPRKEFLSVEELAAWLDVPTYTVTRQARKGLLPGVKVGREWRFSRTAILRLFSADTDPHEELDQPPTPEDAQHADRDTSD